MKISYNWLKAYIPKVPSPEKLADIFTYHLCEVEGIEKKTNGDTIFDINILPNRAHDLLSHQGIAREIASLLDIEYIDPTLKYKIPDFKQTTLQIKIEPEKCRRYMGRIVRNIKVDSSPDWIKEHLESIGQRSINNIVDAANIVMYDYGQPIHCFDLDKVKGDLIVRHAENEEEIVTLDNKHIKLIPADLVIADEVNVLAIAGIKGGKIAEVDNNTKNIIIEVANFDPASVRKTGKRIHIFTDALKRFENDLSPELVSFAMLAISALFVEYGIQEFEEVVDVYPKKQAVQTLSFDINKISKILGLKISSKEMNNILKRYNFEYTSEEDNFEIIVPFMRLDLGLEEDMAEEVARILGYDKIKSKIPRLDFKPKINDTYLKIQCARSKLLKEGYSEVINYTFAGKGKIEVLESASDKKFLRTNLSDGLKESWKLNKNNLSLLEDYAVRIFEIGTIFLENKEELHIVYNEDEKIIESTLEEFFQLKENSSILDRFKKEKFGISNLDDFSSKSKKFKMWSLFPFISRDIAVWVPEKITSSEVEKIIKDEAGLLLLKGPDLFDEFRKDGKISYAFKLVFQSYERTLTDTEINEIMLNITNKIKAKGSKDNDWQVR